MKGKKRSFLEVEDERDLAEPFKTLFILWWVGSIIMMGLWIPLVIGMLLWSGFDYGLSIASSNSLEYNLGGLFVVDSWIDKAFVIATIWFTPAVVMMWIRRREF